MVAYLLDTTILSACLDPSHVLHEEKTTALKTLPASASKFVSVVALAELSFGVNLAQALGKGDSAVLSAIIEQARSHAVLDVSHHTASAYAELKANLATKYLAKPLRRDRPKYIEDWIDKANGKSLGVDENDLWMSAQSKERGLIFVSDELVWRARLPRKPNTVIRSFDWTSLGKQALLGGDLAIGRLWPAARPDRIPGRAWAGGTRRNPAVRKPKEANVAKPSKTRQASPTKAVQGTKRTSPKKRAQAKPLSSGANTLARPGTKLASLIALLSKDEGATIGDLTEATGWQAHSVRGAISGTLKKKLGLTVTSAPVDGRGRVYRISDQA